MSGIEHGPRSALVLIPDGILLRIMVFMCGNGFLLQPCFQVGSRDCSAQWIGGLSSVSVWCVALVLIPEFGCKSLCRQKRSVTVRRGSLNHAVWKVTRP